MFTTPFTTPNAALSALNFGLTQPFWDRAVRIQLFRLEQREEYAVALIAAFKRAESGAATETDDLLIAEYKRREEVDPRAHDEIVLALNASVLVDGIFLLLAIRNIVRFAEAQARALKPFGKEAGIEGAKDAFLTTYPLIKDFRDVVEHYDEYVAGRGKRRELIKDDNEGAGIGQDDEGRLVFCFGGHRMPLLVAARDALSLSEFLDKHFWEVVSAERS